jgi:alpha-tubulin suppressor-like RCC1 family protein
VAAGEEHTCGLTNKGNVYCWGRGQRLGLLDALDRNAPTLPVYFASPTRKVVAISAGNEHTCAVTDDPSAPVFCWGRNNYGETGEDPQYVTNNGTPAVVMGFPLPATFTLVAAGADHSCAATNEFMYCWGRNDYGQLGNGENGSSHTPTMVTGLTGQFESVSAGMESTCAIVSSEVFCWGRNRNGTLGDGTTYNANSPVQTWTPPLGGLPIAVTQGGWAGCYVADDGGILCWGYNQYGLLGNGQGLAFHEPAQVPSQVMMPTSIDAGDEHVCAIASSDVWCWGVGGYGQFGLISQPTWEYFEPVMSGIPVTDGSEVAVTVSTGSRHTCAIRQNGQVVCMGYNLHGQVGSGVSGGQVDTATPVVGLSEGAIALSLGGGFSCAITPSGAAKCWGDNDFGQLGIGNTESSPVPQATTVAGEHTFVQLSAGNSHACGIDIAGALYCWGRNDLGQLGDGSFEQSDTPVLVWESGTLHVSAGDDFTCAVDSQNTAYCWGSNAWGKLGIGNDVSSVEFPEQVAGFHQVAKVAAGAYHACMLTVSGEVLCWGQNTEYQLGTKTEGLSNVPDTPVEMWGLVTDIAVGADFSCAVDEFGYVQCWGNNALGQTANGEHRSPSGVPGLHAGGEQQQGG